VVALAHSHAQPHPDPAGYGRAAAMRPLPKRSHWPIVGALALVLAGCGPRPVVHSSTEVALVTPTTVGAGRAVLGQAAAATVEALPTLAPTPLRLTFPDSGPNPVSAWRPPLYSAPWAIRAGDHFYFARPIPSGDVNWAHPLYRYGNTYFGEESTHTGVDLGADRGTPVLAAGPGEVVWVGYGLYRQVTALDDPYGLAIAIRHDFGFENQPLFTVYAHLGATTVWLGQRVATGETIGYVGETGHASGAHLHFEVRLGENRYFSTLNPELWMVPPEGWGILAGRILDSAGNPIGETLVLITSVETGRRWEVWTYALETVNDDVTYHESFAISDLPAGPYEVQVAPFGRAYTTALYVYPGQTNYLVFRSRRGFTIEPTPTAPNYAAPPSIP